MLSNKEFSLFMGLALSASILTGVRGVEQVDSSDCKYIDIKYGDIKGKLRFSNCTPMLVNYIANEKNNN